MQKNRSIILGILVFILTIGLTFLFSSMKKAPKEKKIVKKAMIVPAMKIENKQLNLNVNLVGRLEATKKVDVYAEVTGILEVSNHPFLEGVSFQKGEKLLSINNDKYKSEVYSSKSSFMNEIAAILPDLKFDYPESYPAWKNYLNNFDIETNLKKIPHPINEKEKYYLAGKKIYSNYYQIKSMELQLEKYSLAAPFTGEVIDSQIKPGALVRTGQKLGEFANINSFDLVASIDLNNLKNIKIGSKAKIYSNNITGKWDGTVRRISNKIDEKTQMVDVYISVNGTNLKEGMFLNANVHLEQDVFGVEIPRKLLVNKNSVYLINQDKVTIKDITIIQKKEDTVIAEGLQNGDLLALKTTGIHEGITAKAVLEN